MKMMSRTSMTSTSGTTLISASELDTRRVRPRRPGTASGIGATFGIWFDDQHRAHGAHREIKGILCGLCLGPLREIPLRDIQEFHREIVHLRREQLHALRERIVEVHGGNGGEQARG